ncbi:hypothetical protein Droror1_Dr00014319 [Drosera rotundifolia]
MRTETHALCLYASLVHALHIKCVFFFFSFLFFFAAFFRNDIKSNFLLLGVDLFRESVKVVKKSLYNDSSLGLPSIIFCYLCSLLTIFFMCTQQGRFICS